MAVRIGGTLGDMSVTTQAKAEEPWLHGCTDHQRKCWFEVNDYMRRNPEVKLSKALKLLNYSPPVYYAVKKKAEATPGEAFKCSTRDFIRQDDTVVKNARKEAQQEERATLVYSTKKNPGTPPPCFEEEKEETPPPNMQRWDPKAPAEPEAVEEAVAAPVNEEQPPLPEPPAVVEPEEEVEPAVESVAAAPVLRQWTYQDQETLYDDVQIKVDELSCSEEEACDVLRVRYVDYLQARVAVEEKHAADLEAKQREQKNGKTIEWEQRIERGCEKGIEKVALKMRAGLLEVAAMAEVTDAMKVTLTVMQLLEPLPQGDRQRVLKSVAGFYGVA